MEGEAVLIEATVEQPEMDETIQQIIPVLKSDESYHFVIEALTKVVEEIKKDEKINHYLGKLELTSVQLIELFQVIIESLKGLHVKAKECEIMKHSIGRCWGILEDFMATKTLGELDSKEKTVWFAEIEAKLSRSL